MCKVLYGCVELLVVKVLLEYKDLLAQLVCKANVDQKDNMVSKLIGEQGDRGERGERGAKGEKVIL